MLHYSTPKSCLFQFLTLLHCPKLDKQSPCLANIHWSEPYCSFLASRAKTIPLLLVPGNAERSTGCADLLHCVEGAPIQTSGSHQPLAEYHVSGGI